MKSLIKILVLALLLISGVSSAFALMEIDLVSRARAKELGMEVRATDAGPKAVRIELEFPLDGELKNYSRVDLEMHDGGELMLSATLREEKSKPGRVRVSCAADRGNLDRLMLRVVTEHSERTRIGHDLKVKDFVETKRADAPDTKTEGARLTTAEAIRIAEEAARKEGVKLDNYKAPEAHYEYTRIDKTWFVFFDGKVTRPGNHFSVNVDDLTKETRFIRGR
jgi:hypothetical protein